MRMSTRLACASRITKAFYITEYFEGWPVTTKAATEIKKGDKSKCFAIIHQGQITVVHETECNPDQKIRLNYNGESWVSMGLEKDIEG